MRQREILRKGLAMLLVIVMTIGFLPGVGSLEVSAEEADTSGTNSIKLTEPEGKGTEASPYQIGTAEELYWFAALVNGKLLTEQNGSAYAVLTKDITVNKNVLKSDGTLNDGSFIEWTPIGSGYINKFRGTFDGKNHTISGLYFNDTESSVGLFGVAGEDGNILNVGVIDSYFKGDNNVGGVCGWNDGATITYCYNTGKVVGSDCIGGVCGCFGYGTIQYCYNTNVVEGIEAVGGVCGATYGGTVKDSYYDMEVYSNSVPIGINSNGKTTVVNVEGKTTGQMHSEAFCKEMGYHLYQNGICALCVTAYQEAPCNNGTYEISNAGQLYWFADKVNSADTTYQKANAVLTADIVVNKNVLNSDGTLNKDSSFKDWIPIGRDYVDSNGKRISYPYAGVFDGQNHTISGVYYESSNEDYGGGLFGKVEGNVRNIGILDSYFNGSVNYLGGICGKNSGTIENCYNTGTVSGAGPVGGICGKNEGTIENCYNTGTVSGEMYYIGGICGGSSSLSTIKNCYNTGAVSGLQYVGGVCGTSDQDTIANCYNIGKVKGSSEVGGVCGTSDQDTIANCYNIGKVAGSSNVGGVCGYYSGNTMSNCYYNNEVYAGTAIGVDNNGTATKVGGKTTEEFQSGEVAWLLQDGQEDQTELVWGQTLTGDSTQEFPVLKGEKVYKVNKYAVCEDAKVIGEPIGVLYSNSDKPIYGPHKDDGSGDLNKAYDNKCDFCGTPCHSFNEAGICKEDGYHRGDITITNYNTTVAYCGEYTDAQPKLGDFTVASGTVPEFTWYKDDVTTDDLPTGETVLGETAPKELGTYTLVVNAAGAENNGIVYTAAELRVLVEIKKVPLAGTVTLEGTLKCNETVTVNKDGITHPHPGALSYKWYRVDGENESVIDGATEPSYTLTTKDIGKKIRVEVYADNCTDCLSATTETTVNKLDGSAEIKSTSGELSKYWDETTILTPTFRTSNNKGTNNENVTFEYKKITDTDYTMTAPTDAGTYHVRVKVKADSIHSEAVSEPVEFTIAKVNSEVEVAPVAAKNLIYTQGKTVTLIDASNASVTGGQLQYALGENGTYSTVLPTVTAAGTYSVYYKVVGDRNHNDTEPVKIDVTVSKAAPSYQAPTDISAACGAMLSAVQLPIGFGWTDKDVTLEAGDTETGIQIIKKAKYVPEDTTNYEEVTDIAITIQVTHDSEVKGVVEPTCTEKGYTGNTCCKHCGTKLQSGTDIAALGHDFAKDFTVDTEATCKSVGSKSRHCIRCEEKTEITEIPKSDHTWDDGKITKEATETAEGVKTYSCKKCDATKTETVPKKDAVTTQPSKDTTMTQPPKEEPTSQQSTEELTVSQPAKNGDVITDNKSDATYEVTDTVKKEVTYNAPVDGKAKDITIPETVVINGETYKITHIDENAFKGNKTVTTVTIGRNIQSIGKNAFKGCKRLKTIVIQSKKLNMKKISKKAFKGISKKTVIKVPKKKLVAYRKLLKKKGLSSKNRIKGY